MSDRPGRRRPSRGSTARRTASAPSGASTAGARPAARRRREATPPPTRARGRVVTLLALVLCLALLGAAGSGVFRVRHVDVIGTGLPATDIVATSGLEGANIFRVRSDNVVTKLSAIRQITVQRVDMQFPDTVVIHAALRTPFVAWRNGIALYLLDRDGQIIEQVPSTTLPVINGSGSGATLGPGIVAAVRYAIETLPTAPNGAVASFQLDPHTGLILLGRSGWQAYVGGGGPQTLVNRIAALVSFLRSPQVQNRTLKLVDLRSKAPYAQFASP